MREGEEEASGGGSANGGVPDKSGTRRKIAIVRWEIVGGIRCGSGVELEPTFIVKL